MRAIILLACASLAFASLPGVSADDPSANTGEPTVDHFIPEIGRAIDCEGPTLGPICAWGYCSGSSNAGAPDAKVGTDGVVVYVPPVAVLSGFYLGFANWCYGHFP